MALEVFVSFNGNCRAAVEFYATVFGLEKPKMMTYGEAPPDPEYPLSEEVKNLVMYTSLAISGSNIMFSDMPPEMPFIEGNNISLAIVSKDSGEIRTLFNKMKEGGMVSMELQETFWSKCFGMLTDQFGVNWQFSQDSGQMAM